MKLRTNFDIYLKDQFKGCGFFRTIQEGCQGLGCGYTFSGFEVQRKKS
ncbi:MAG: hypothetical protein JRJ46_08105 [Deltaproteobacteria bacterium]|nr:hypothetical protein [Deltaproteobacteria bacterium]